MGKLAQDQNEQKWGEDGGYLRIAKVSIFSFKNFDKKKFRTH